MNKWLLGLAIVGSLVGCAEGEQRADDEGAETLRQATTATDAGVSPGTLGSPCAADTDCTATGTGAKCITKGATTGILFPEGYCTLNCKTDAQCGKTGICPLGRLADLAAAFLPDAGAAASSISLCFTKCTADKDCRTGYTCVAPPALPFGGAAPAAKYCQPPLPDGGALPPGIPGLPGGGGFPGLPRPPR